MAPEAAAAPLAPGADRPALDDDLAALVAVLEEIDCCDREIAELVESRDQALERRNQINRRVSPFFQGLPQPSVVSGRDGTLYGLHQGMVRVLPHYSAAAAEALCPVPGRPVVLPPGWKMVGDSPGAGPGPGPAGPRHGDRLDAPRGADACCDLGPLEEVS